MKISYAAICIVFVLLLSEAELSMGAMTCNPLELSPCASAITGANAPSAICCSKLKEQRICLCQYMKDPNLRKAVLIYIPGLPLQKQNCTSLHLHHLISFLYSVPLLAEAELSMVVNGSYLELSASANDTPEKPPYQATFDITIAEALKHDTIYFLSNV
ncbi:hypothetical protein WN943_011800 [Citrus x changshan-huyou]